MMILTRNLIKSTNRRKITIRVLRCPKCYRSFIQVGIHQIGKPNYSGKYSNALIPCDECLSKEIRQKLKFNESNKK